MPAPRFAGEDDQLKVSAPQLGQWPTWQMKPEENRSFTND
jgi:hypothetical protein